MMANMSDTQLDQYGRDNSQYPPSNAGLGVDRQPALPMQRVSSGPISVVGKKMLWMVWQDYGYHPVTHDSLHSLGLAHKTTHGVQIAARPPPPSLLLLI